MQKTNQTLKISTAMAKYTVTLNASTIVVISGDAISAGSSFIAFAAMGSAHPKVWARQTVKNIAALDVIASFTVSGE